MLSLAAAVLTVSFQSIGKQAVVRVLLGILRIFRLPAENTVKHSRLEEQIDVEISKDLETNAVYKDQYYKLLTEKTKKIKNK